MPRINVANPRDKAWSRNSFLFQFGAYGCTWVLVYADSINDGLEEAACWLADNAPGHLTSMDEMTQLVKEACEDAGLAWPLPDDVFDGTHREYEKAIESAEADMTYTESGWLTSYEWYVEENPSKAQLIALHKG